MSSPIRRLVEIDFFRGVVLIVIVIDHMTESLLSNITLHNFAYCDAAEVFVFLGGFSTAAAFEAIERRGVRGAATRRFLLRAWEIYRAYLLTAALMIAAGLVMLAAKIQSPLLPYTEAPELFTEPLTLQVNIASLRLQPFLASVLPMYSIFALLAPLTVPLMRRRPALVFLGSGILWLFAAPIAQHLPSADPGGWPFNPFAWQLLFVLGLGCRVHPVSRDFQMSRCGVWLTRLALAVFLGFAVFKVFIYSAPMPGYQKQNLAAVRVLSFVCLAWLCGEAVRRGWVAALADKMKSVVVVGRQGLICFVSGTVVSIVCDTALRVAGGAAAHWPVRAASDVVAIGSLLLIARIAQARKAARQAAYERRKSPAARRPLGDNA